MALLQPWASASKHSSGDARQTCWWGCSTTIWSQMLFPAALPSLRSRNFGTGNGHQIFFEQCQDLEPQIVIASTPWSAVVRKLEPGHLHCSQCCVCKWPGLHLMASHEPLRFLHVRRVCNGPSQFRSSIKRSRVTKDQSKAKREYNPYNEALPWVHALVQASGWWQ